MITKNKFIRKDEVKEDIVQPLARLLLPLRKNKTGVRYVLSQREKERILR